MKKITSIFISLLLCVALHGNVYGAETVTKGLIGEQDIHKWNGTASDKTFTRSSSTGGALTLNSVGFTVDALITYGGGTSYTQATLEACATAVGSSVVTILVRPGTWATSSNMNLTAIAPNATFKIVPGAIISHGAYTVSIPNIEAGLYQIFSNSGALATTGTVTITNGDRHAAWWGFDVAATAAVNAVAIQSAIASTATTVGKTIRAHAGVFAVAPDIISFTGYNSTRLIGAGPGYGYESSKAATELYFSAGTLGIAMYDAASPWNVTAYNEIVDIKVNGHGVLATGIKYSGSNYIRRVSVQGCTTAGIHAPDGLIGATMENISCSYNTGGIGLWIQGASSTTWNLKGWNIFRANKIGLQIEGSWNSRADTILAEGNTEEGIIIYKTGAQTGPGNILFDTVYLEDNWPLAGTGYQLKIHSYVSNQTANSSPSYLTFRNVYINLTGTTRKYIYIKEGQHITFDNTFMSGGDSAAGLLIDENNAMYVHWYSGSVATPVGDVWGSRGGYWNRDTNGSGGFKTNMVLALPALTTQRAAYDRGGLIRTVAEGSANIEADASTTITLSIPAKAILLGAELRVDTALTGGETWDAAYSGGSTTAIASNQAVAKDTKVYTPYDTNAATAVTSNTTNIAITKNGGGSFTAAGTIRAWVYYEYMDTIPAAP